MILGHKEKDDRIRKLKKTFEKGKIFTIREAIEQTELCNSYSAMATFLDKMVSRDILTRFHISQRRYYKRI